MRKYRVLVAIAISFGMSAAFVPTSIAVPVTPDVHQLLTAQAQNINRDAASDQAGELVQLIDSSVKGKILVNQYRMAHRDAKDIDTKVFAASVLPTLQAGICQNSQAVQLLQLGASVNYVYVDQNSVPIASYPIGQSDCS